MALSEQTIRELKTDLDALKEERAALDRRILFLEEYIQNRSYKTPETPSEIVVESLNALTQVLTFSERILAVLRKHPTGLAPVDVSEEIKKSGFSLDRGKATDLRARTANELWRLSHKGVVKKTDDGRYQVIVRN